MTTTRKSHRSVRLATALLVATMASVTLTATPVSAASATSATGDIVSPSADAGKNDSAAAARTSTANAEIELPVFAQTPCPELSDSIVRLYSAYFLRAPDQGGFEFWLEEYFAGNWSLPRMSAHFSQSAEFVDTYGGITDEQFIDLIYNNIFGRAADQGGRDYWLGRMAAEGLDRGTVMLFFSESPEYIEQSGTFTPFAGEFNWYPDNTELFCGFDNIDAALPETTTYVDLAFYNDSSRANTVTASLLIDGVWQTWDQATIEFGEWFIFFGVEMDSSVTGLRLEGTEGFIWTLAYAQSPTPPVRSGWITVI